MIIFSACVCAGIISRGSHCGNVNVSEMVFILVSIKCIKDFEHCQSRRFISARLRGCCTRQLNVEVAGRTNTIWPDYYLIEKRCCTSVLCCKRCSPKKYLQVFVWQIMAKRHKLKLSTQAKTSMWENVSWFIYTNTTALLTKYWKEPLDWCHLMQLCMTKSTLRLMSRIEPTTFHFRWMLLVWDLTFWNHPHFWGLFMSVNSYYLKDIEEYFMVSQISKWVLTSYVCFIVLAFSFSFSWSFD